MTQIISHSEVDQFLTCQRKHWYAFGHPIGDSFGLESKSKAAGLFKGITGHTALAAYYGWLKHCQDLQDGHISGDDMSQAHALAMKTLTESMLDNSDRGELVMMLSVILNKYFAYYYDADQTEYKYLSVEDEFRYEVDSELVYAFRPDMIRMNRKTGVIDVVDHKFLSNLYQGEQIGILPQLPKYVAALRRMGYSIKDATYNMVFNRVLVSKPYEASPQTMRRVGMNLTDRRIETSWTEQVRVMRAIAAFKSQANPEDWEFLVTRTANSFNCKTCPFLELCTADLNGEDTTVAVKYNFVPNTYGYAEAGVSDD